MRISDWSSDVCSSDLWAQLVQFGAILVLLSSGVVYLRRAHLGEALRNLAIWAAIGAALLLGSSFRPALSGLGSLLAGELMPSPAGGVAEGVVGARAGAGGHFGVPATVTGVPVTGLL